VLLPARNNIHNTAFKPIPILLFERFAIMHETRYLAFVGHANKQATTAMVHKTSYFILG